MWAFIHAHLKSVSNSDVTLLNVIRCSSRVALFYGTLSLFLFFRPWPSLLCSAFPSLYLILFSRPWPSSLYSIFFFPQALTYFIIPCVFPVSFLFSRLSLLYSVPVSFLFPRPWPSLLSSIPWSIFFFSPGLDLVYYVGEEFDIILLQIILAFLSIFYTSVCLWCVVCVFAVVVVVIIICSCSVSLCIFSGSCWNPLTYRPSTTSL